MNKFERLKVAAKQQLEQDFSGHDYEHALRVVSNSQKLLKQCNLDVNPDIVLCGSLLHDVADHKFGYDDSDRERIIGELLISSGYDNQQFIEAVVHIANNISFSKAVDKNHLSTEALIVQDADRLEAIGAVGIARTFAYGGSKNRSMYNSQFNIEHKQQNPEDRDTVYHFYEKLLLVKDDMNTEVGKNEAISRTEFMELFLEQFYKEIR